MRLATVLIALAALSLAACSKSEEAAGETHATEAAGPATAEELNRRAAEDAAAAATAPLESLPKIDPNGAPPAMADAAHAEPAATADHAAPATEAAPPPADHH